MIDGADIDRETKRERATENKIDMRRRRKEINNIFLLSKKSKKSYNTAVPIAETVADPNNEVQCSNLAKQISFLMLVFKAENPYSLTKITVILISFRLTLCRTKLKLEKWCRDLINKSEIMGN